MLGTRGIISSVNDKFKTVRTAAAQFLQSLEVVGSCLLNNVSAPRAMRRS